MNTLKCMIEGCLNFFSTEETVSENVRYICKNHPRAVQVRAAGRSYDERADNLDTEVHFQEYQFDKDLARGGSPKIDSGDEASPNIFVQKQRENEADSVDE